MSAKTKTTMLFLIPPVIAVLCGILFKRYDTVLPSLLAVLCIAVLAALHHKFPFLRAGTYYGAILLILLSLFAGKALRFYFIIPHWDKMLHFLSGFLFVAAGEDIYAKCKGDADNRSLVSLFALSFAIAAAGLWEVYEFLGDLLFGTSSQNGSLSDTMLDIIAGTVSAFLAVLPRLICKKR